MRFDFSNLLAGVQSNAEKTVNEHFGRVSLENPLDQEHAAKRAEAFAVVSGKTCSVSFSEASVIEGCSVLALAEAILAKPDNVLERGNTRRSIILEIRAAKSSDEIEAILAKSGISQS